MRRNLILGAAAALLFGSAGNAAFAQSACYNVANASAPAVSLSILRYLANDPGVISERRSSTLGQQIGYELTGFANPRAPGDAAPAAVFGTVLLGDPEKAIMGLTLTAAVPSSQAVTLHCTTPEGTSPSTTPAKWTCFINDGSNNTLNLTRIPATTLGCRLGESIH